MKLDDQFVKSIRIVFAGIVTMPVLFALVAWFSQSGGKHPLMEQGDIFAFAIPLIAAAAIAGSIMIYRNRITAIQSMSDEGTKLNAWKSAFIIRMALVEGAAMFSVVAFFLNGAFMYICIVIILTAIQLKVFPTYSSIKDDCNIS